VLQQADPGFEWQAAAVTGPIPTMTVTARYLLHPARRLAVVEAAQAHGIKLLSKPAPMTATSYGVGDLLNAALRQVQAKNIPLEALAVTVGGSASTDGGLGALQALGVRFRDAVGAAIREPLSGGSLSRIQAVERSESWPFAGRLLIATDVRNPLLGPEGCATVFAPQKGADPGQCAQLETGLRHVSGLMQAAFGADHTVEPGAGAAGGLAYGLCHLPRAELISGTCWIAGQLDLERRIQAADWIITGEGRLDATSLAGKATGQILRWAAPKPVLVFCGQVQESQQWPEHVQVFPLARTQAECVAAMANPEAALRQALERALPVLQRGLLAGSRAD
jgi:glycerate kinase